MTRLASSGLVLGHRWRRFYKGAELLVLSRKVGEKIRISDDITLVVVKISGERIQLGVQAPEAVAIYRKELLDKGRKDAQSV